MAKSVLICHDAAFMRVMIKDILTKNGYNVAGEAENGLKAVEKYNELKNSYPNNPWTDLAQSRLIALQSENKIQ